MISVVILTLNEEVNLPGCLASVGWCDDVVVYDSFSTDGTAAIAEAAGARVFKRKFDTYAAQRRAALSEVEYRHPWVLMVDADERWPEEMYAEIAGRLEKEADTHSLYRFLRRDMFLGRWLRRSSGYPTWAGRLVKIGHVRVERDINEEYWTDGIVGHMRGHFIHYPFNKGVAFWFERHNRYSSMEAAALVRETGGPLPWSAVLSRDPALRRKGLKQLAYRLPGRPVLVFGYLYVFRLGFLDGVPGFVYCVLRSVYEFMIDLKVKEIRRRAKGLPV